MNSNQYDNAKIPWIGFRAALNFRKFNPFHRIFLNFAKKLHLIMLIMI